MSKKKANQFMCSSMMLPEHREQLAKRSLKARGEREDFSASQTPEELVRCLNQSFFAKKPAELMVKKGAEIQQLTGVMVDSNAYGGKIRLLSDSKITAVALDRIISCRLEACEEEADG